MKIVTNIWICVDCMFYLENGEGTRPIGLGEFDDWRRELSANWNSETGAGIEEFGYCRCILCDNRSGGTWHRYAVWH